MGLYNTILIIASHMTDLLFGFLLPHLSSSVYVGPDSVSANSAVASHLCATDTFLGQMRRAIPWAIHYYISCWFLGCLTSPDLTMLFFHPKADPVHSRCSSTALWLWLLASVCLDGISISPCLHCIGIQEALRVRTFFCSVNTTPTVLVHFRDPSKGMS